MRKLQILLNVSIKLPPWVYTSFVSTIMVLACIQTTFIWITTFYHLNATQHTKTNTYLSAVFKNFKFILGANGLWIRIGDPSAILVQVLVQQFPLPAHNGHHGLEMVWSRIQVVSGILLQTNNKQTLDSCVEINMRFVCRNGLGIGTLRFIHTQFTHLIFLTVQPNTHKLLNHY